MAPSENRSQNGFYKSDASIQHESNRGNTSAIGFENSALSNTFAKDTFETRKNIMAHVDNDESNRKGEVNRMHLLIGSSVSGLNRKMSRRLAFQKTTEAEATKPFYKLQRQTQVDLIAVDNSKGPPLARQNLLK